MDVIRKDVERLQKLTGCCLPLDYVNQAYAYSGGGRDENSMITNA
jgi:hypothetical protein